MNAAGRHPRGHHRGHRGRRAAHRRHHLRKPSSFPCCARFPPACPPSCGGSAGYRRVCRCSCWPGVVPASAGTPDGRATHRPRSSRRTTPRRSPARSTGWIIGGLHLRLHDTGFIITHAELSPIAVAIKANADVRWRYRWYLGLRTRSPCCGGGDIFASIARRSGIRSTGISSAAMSWWCGRPWWQPADHPGLAYDSGGVTTSTVTVPPVAPAQGLGCRKPCPAETR